MAEKQTHATYNKAGEFAGIFIGTASQWDRHAARHGLTTGEAPPAASLDHERALMQATAAQIRLALFEAGLLDLAAMAAKSDPRAEILWEYATIFRRSSPLFDALGGPAGLTPEAIDDLFRAAMKIDAGAAT